MGGAFLAGALFAVPGCGDDSGTGGSGGGTGGSGGGTTTTTGGGGSDPGVSCSAYCEAIQTNCKDANGQYSSMASCMGSCEGTFPMGTAADMAGNTLGCRAYHAGAAAGDPGTHCGHAGPSGAGACGTIQQGFCSIAPVVCPAVYTDNAACMSDTAALDVTKEYTTAEVSGDTLACRLYHLQFAAESEANQMVHCPHIPAASPVCTP